ncbi:hypothetical protein BDK88_2112 [Natrinema hispanicum]|uniref:Uncharacterized protein n=1 Tax=Natrinema hispanicum TaxID=392421 RepID=A0A482Y8R1_9EURY|nr:hypothetical protein BDK88_2112 [Natrinema hispanicum]
MASDCSTCLVGLMVRYGKRGARTIPKLITAWIPDQPVDHTEKKDLFKITKRKLNERPTARYAAVVFSIFFLLFVLPLVDTLERINLPLIAPIQSAAGGLFVGGTLYLIIHHVGEHGDSVQRTECESEYSDRLRGLISHKIPSVILIVITVPVFFYHFYVSWIGRVDLYGLFLNGAVAGFVVTICNEIHKSAVPVDAADE